MLNEKVGPNFWLVVYVDTTKFRITFGSFNKFLASFFKGRVSTILCLDINIKHSKTFLRCL